MALNATGQISMGGTIVGQSINLELDLSATANSNINQTNFRTLANIPTGTISLNDFHGKANIINVAINTNQTQYSFSPAKVPGYVAGQTRAKLTIGDQVYLYSTNINIPALTVEGFVTGDYVEIVNNGFIIGMGGAGGITDSGSEYAENGGPAISTTFNLVVENNSYIAGGGGGGADGAVQTGGGGGAGGGKGGHSAYYGTDGGLGGAPGMPGGNAVIVAPYGFTAGGGGGGRILPGLGGAGGLCSSTIPLYGGQGGGAGGGGSAGAYEPDQQNGGAGGSANSPGNVPPPFGGIQFGLGAGGGGGWGASGGDSANTPGAGGKAVNLNGHSITIYGAGYFYGAVS